MDGTMAGNVSLSSQVWTFGRHFVEMCVSMCVGVGLATVLLNGAPVVGYADLRQQWPGLSLLAIAVVIALPMAAWMRFRGHGLAADP